MRLIHAGLHFFLVGIVILTLGIALTIQSMLGTSPFDSLLVGLNRTFGLTVGSWEIVVGASMVLCNAVAERKRPEYFALLTSFITGIGIDSWLFIVGDWIVPETWIGRSEEHTSELQSRFDLVCRLLLEKKNTHIHIIYIHV